MLSSCFLFGLVVLFCTYFSCCLADELSKKLSSLTPFVNVSTTWTLNNSLFEYGNFTDGSRVRPILISRATTDNRVKFGCGFYCRGGNCTHYVFSVFILVHDSHLLPLVYAPPQLVWSANPKHPVREGAMLILDAQAGLVLHDSDYKTVVWTSYLPTSQGMSISGLVLNDNGNLELYDARYSLVWDSFSCPSDSLLPGQKLTQGANKLIPTSPFTDRKIPYKSFYLQVTGEGVFTYLDSTPPTLYYRYLVKPGKKPVNSQLAVSYIRLLNGSVACFIVSAEPNEPDIVFSIPRALSVQYLKLMPDGHLIVREWNLQEWTQVADIFKSPRGNCGQPLACGENSVCSVSNQQCDCVGSQFFRPKNFLQKHLGCYPLAPLQCNDTNTQRLLLENNVQHRIFKTHMESVDMLTCYRACSRECSCKAAVFRRDSDSSNGSCYLPTKVDTLVKLDPSKLTHKDKTFIKIQMPESSHAHFGERSHPQRQGLPIIIIIAICLGVFVVFGVFAFIISFYKYLKEKRNNEQLYQRLKSDDIEENLIGRGAQGYVFQGTLDDSMIAVKRFEGRVGSNESFNREVKAIASLHHVNVLKLIGYCPLVDSPLLVYEYMVNGSLDKWIHGVKREAEELTWSTWKLIITQIAKGILHFDLKPENVLLDADFSVKICDFGSSRFISTSQRQNTSEALHLDSLKGTVGYIAPERAHGEIKTTADVYSFGVIVLEICCIEQKKQLHDLRFMLGTFTKTRNIDDIVGKGGRGDDGR
ncbi:Apple-like protein [Artemisia annua]|uniref:Receptor-like serine/threonine-protein kinase n=1 Tax=Artemisia annua TaxID=35608 RepID=A0A2U1PFV0_ARTAN|nr:Apple-like protein [Artemisia annua]